MLQHAWLTRTCFSRLPWSVGCGALWGGQHAPHAPQGWQARPGGAAAGDVDCGRATEAHPLLCAPVRGEQARHTCGLGVAPLLSFLDKPLPATCVHACMHVCMQVAQTFGFKLAVSNPYGVDASEPGAAAGAAAAAAAEAAGEAAARNAGEAGPSGAAPVAGGTSSGFVQLLPLRGRLVAMDDEEEEEEEEEEEALSPGVRPRAGGARSPTAAGVRGGVVSQSIWRQGG